MTDGLSQPAARRIRPDNAWDRARHDYLAGATAEEVCRRHDLGLSAFKVRARQEGWRRADQPAPEPLDETINLDGPPEPRERMLDKAWRRVSRALDDGHSTDAMRWMRVHAMLLAADRAELRDRDRNTADAMRAVTRTARDGEIQALATLRRIQAETPSRRAKCTQCTQKKPATASSTPPDPDEPGLSRAERRRRLREAQRRR